MVAGDPAQGRGDSWVWTSSRRGEATPSAARRLLLLLGRMPTAAPSGLWVAEETTPHWVHMGTALHHLGSGVGLPCQEICA